MTERFDTTVQMGIALYGGWAFLAALTGATVAHTVWYSWTH